MAKAINCVKISMPACLTCCNLIAYCLGKNTNFADNQRMLGIIGIETLKAALSLFIHNCMQSNIYVHTISSSDTGTNILGKKYIADYKCFFVYLSLLWSV